MLGLFGARSSDSEPPRSDLGSGELWPPRYASDSTNALFES